MSRPHFSDIQRAFAAHLRDPRVNPPPPGIEERRLAIYRELFYNNVENFLSGFFPVLRSLYADADWHAMARDFFAKHRSRTPYFLEIAEEFLSYLAHERVPLPCDPPFLRDLAHYEWLELAVDVADEALSTTGIDPAGDLLAGVPVFSPAAVLAPYRWPVHRISPDYRPDEPLVVPVFLVVYRGQDERVHFLEVNAMTAGLMTLASEQPHLTGRELARRLAEQTAHPEPDVLLAGAGQLLDLLRDRHIVLGSRPAGA